ncbi:hypothetical protein A8C56_06075 [Niabella ginsenosidivorans]|uniref:FecR protein domain-containing protein n=1 Tax=Niabella ginsenosidivorans TaxID=1176587 RepID=A0A1A9HZ01_9BACT|nr:FecR domain-containing protein [Niabella ginsenosidivorans]ANH80606.1 hypothetical protein A8C56_06075 [Niabella ginsenosidivorans]
MENWSKDTVSRKLIQKALNKLNAEENVVLERMINEDDAIKKEWEEIVLLTEQWPDLPDEQAGWLQLEPRLTDPPAYLKPLKRSYKKLISVAAALFIIGVLSYIAFWAFKPASEPITATTDPVRSKQLALKLGNGQTVNLGKVSNIVLDNGIKIENDSSGRMLSYNGEVNTDEVNTLFVPPGLDYRLNLSDGTEIMLNSATTLKFPFKFNGSKREITISGEAYLKVAHDANRPFIVHLPNGDVKVLGTEFNVNTYTQSEKVSLVKGSIDFVSANDSVRLRPGYAALVLKGGFKTVVLDQNDLAWIEGRYILDGTSVREIAQLIPRWYGVDVKIDNEEVANRVFDGVIYKNKPLDGLLELLKGTTDVDYYYQGNVLHLK